jgi:hypothetical protein
MRVSFSKLIHRLTKPAGDLVKMHCSHLLTDCGVPRTESRATVSRPSPTQVDTKSSHANRPTGRGPHGTAAAPVKGLHVSSASSSRSEFAVNAMGLGRVRRRSSKLFGLACGTAPEQSILATVRRPGRAAPAAQSAGIGTAATQTKVDGSMITAARRPRGQAKFAAPPIVHSLTCSRRIVSQFGDVLVDERKGSFRSVPARQYRLRHHVVMCWRSPALRRPCCEEAGSSSTVGSSMSGGSLCLWSSASPAGFWLAVSSRSHAVATHSVLWRPPAGFPEDGGQRPTGGCGSSCAVSGRPPRFSRPFRLPVRSEPCRRGGPCRHGRCRGRFVVR